MWPGITGSERILKWKRKAKEGICGCFLRRESEELQGYGVRAKGGWESQEMLTE